MSGKFYEKKNLREKLAESAYQGRGIVIGTSPAGDKAAIAYFIMGRSENSRNRVFKKEGDDIMIYPFDESKVEDPSLIIYAPLRTLGKHLIVTNGDQTDTVRDFVRDGKTFKEALETRCFEPDGPNWTPRISGMLTLDRGGFSYEMSILKSIDEEGSDCARYTYSYPSRPGLGHFLHTYEVNENPLPTFWGEPRRVEIPETPKELFDSIWETLNEENKISLYVRYTDLKTGKYEDLLVNKYR